MLKRCIPADKPYLLWECFRIAKVQINMFLTSSTLASLRFFSAAARTLSFKQAGVELHVTQGAVSQHIKQLEGALGCKLFFRMPRQVRLTVEGQRFASVVDYALRDIEAVARSLAAHSATEIRLRAGPSFALRWLVPRLGDFYAKHPNVKLAVAAAYGYIDPARREFDVAIEATKGKIASLHSTLLMEDYLVPVCGPEYLAKHRFLKHPGDLARCTLLHDGDAWLGEEADAEWRYWLRAVRALTVDSKQGYFFSLANMSIEAALANQGVAMGRTVLIKELLKSGRLVAPLPQRVKSPLKYYVVYPKELASLPAMQSVLGWLHQQADPAD